MVDGIIPTNSHGNVFMYRPGMVPVGCVHLPYQGALNIANRLGVPAAPALVGWEYKKGKGFPVLQGIVVAQEHAELLNQVYFDTMEIKEKEKADKEAQAMVAAMKKDARKRKIDAYVDSTYPPNSIMPTNCGGCNSILIVGGGGSSSNTNDGGGGSGSSDVQGGGNKESKESNNTGSMDNDCF